MKTYTLTDSEQAHIRAVEREISLLSEAMQRRTDRVQAFIKAICAEQGIEHGQFLSETMTITEIITLILAVIATLVFLFVFTWLCIVLGHSNEWADIEDEILKSEARE